MATKQKKQEKAAAPGAKAQSSLQPVAATAGTSSNKFKELGQYFEDAKTELGKVSWPTKKDVRATSIAVFILVVVMAIFLGVADVLLSKIMEAVLSIGL